VKEREREREREQYYRACARPSEDAEQGCWARPKLRESPESASAMSLHPCTSTRIAAGRSSSLVLPATATPRQWSNLRLKRGRHRAPDEGQEQCMSAEQATRETSDKSKVRETKSPRVQREQREQGRGRGRGRGGGTTKDKGRYMSKVPLVSLILWSLQIGVSRFVCL
jgi:hypothetical protein